MLRWTNNDRIMVKATIILSKMGHFEIQPKRKLLKKFFEELNMIIDSGDVDAILLKVCLEGGKKVVLENGNIKLYFCSEQVIKRTNCEIYNNDQLYRLLENLVADSMVRSHS